MSEFVAVEGLTISHSSGSLVSGGSFTLTSIPSIKSKIEGKGIYRGTLAFTFTGGTHTSGTPSSALGSGTISVTASKTKADGQLVIRVGDSGSMSGTYVPPSGNPPTVPFSSNVEITDANQNKVKAN